MDHEHNTLKICQYNIFFGDSPQDPIDYRIDRVCKTIIDANADVICLQEVLKSQYHKIKTKLSVNYPYIYPDTGIDITYDTIIVSKYPITKGITHRFEFTNMGRNLKIVLLTDNKSNKYYICTTHFESEFKDDCNIKTFQYKRCAEILTLLHQKTNIPVFLCTDSNSCVKTDTIFNEAFSFALGWRDTWIENGSNRSTEYTFNSYTNPILKSKNYGNNNFQKYRSRLDRIVHISNMYSLYHTLFGNSSNITLSDHYGIITNFSSNKPDNRKQYIPPNTTINT